MGAETYTDEDSLNKQGKGAEGQDSSDAEKP